DCSDRCRRERHGVRAPDANRVAALRRETPMPQSLSIRSTLAALALASVAGAQTVLFHEDFENGLGNWSTSAQWHQADANDVCGALVAPFPSGAKSAQFGHVTSSSCSFNGWIPGDLTLLVPIAIPASATDVRLRYETFEQTECPTFDDAIGNCGWDHR